MPRTKSREKHTIPDPKTRLRTAEPGKIPITGVPTAPMMYSPDRMPMDTLDYGHMRAQFLKPCPIIATINQIYSIVQSKNIRVAPEAKDLLPTFKNAEGLAIKRVEHCKETPSLHVLLDFNDVPDEDLKQQADAYRDETLRIKELQTELVARIQKLDSQSKKLWGRLKKDLELDTSKHTYQYSLDEHKLYKIDPDCSVCTANKDITAAKTELEQRASALEPRTAPTSTHTAAPAGTLPPKPSKKT